MRNFLSSPNFSAIRRPSSPARYELRSPPPHTDATSKHIGQLALESYYPTETNRNAQLELCDAPRLNLPSPTFERPPTPRPVVPFPKFIDFSMPRPLGNHDMASKRHKPHPQLLAWATQQGIAPREAIERTQIMQKINQKIAQAGIQSYDTVIVVPGDLTLDGYQYLSELPPNLHVQGSLLIHKCLRLRKIPQQLRVTGDLLLCFCPTLETLSASLIIDGSFVLRECPNVRQIPKNMTVAADWLFVGCTQQFCWPNHLHIQGVMAIVDSMLPTNWMPPQLQVDRHLIFIACTMPNLELKKAQIAQDLVLIACLAGHLLRYQAHIGGTSIIADEPEKIMTKPNAPIYQHLQESLMLGLCIWQREWHGVGFGQIVEDQKLS